MTAVWMRLRAELRSRWRAMLGLAVLLGIMAGAATAAAAGARRTETAYARFYDRYRVQDVLFTTGGHPEYEKIFAEAGVVPGVEATFRGSVYPASVRTSDGLELSFPEMFLVSEHKRYPQYPPGKVLDGRLSDPNEPHEALVNYAMAERLGIEAGETVAMTLFGPQDAERPPPPQEISVTITAVVAIAGHFEQVDASGFTRTFHMTPAFQQRYGTYSFINDDNFGVRLRDGAEGVDKFLYALEDQLIFHLGIEDPFDQPPVATRAEAAGVQGLDRVAAVALWLLAAFVAITTIAVFTQLLARELRLGAKDHPPLRAIGMARGDLFAVSMLRSVVIAVLSAAISVGVAYALSPLTPVGLARIAEPDPGLSFAPRILGVGAAATIFAICGAGAIVAWTTTRWASRARTGPSDRPAPLSERLARAPIGLAIRSGLSMALDSGRGERAIPVRTALLGTTIAAAALMAALTFAGSLSNLLGDPKLAGYTWDAGVIAAAFESPPSEYVERMEEAVRERFPTAKLWPGTVFAEFVVDGLTLTLQASTGPSPSIIEGRAPQTADEVALDRRTLEQLDKGIGDTVDVASDDLGSAYTVRVVGSFAVPRIAFEAQNPGQAVALTIEGVERIDAGCEQPEDESDCDYAEALYVDFADDTELFRNVSAVREAAGGDAFAVLSRDQSPTVGNVERISSLPTMLAALTGFLGMATLAHALTTTIRRRRRDLAVMKTLGVIGRQIRGIVAWQSTALVAGSLLVGVPAGILAGRWGWRLFAEELEVVPVPIVSPLVVLAVAAGGLVTANLIAAFPARAAAHTQAAVVLRTE